MLGHAKTQDMTQMSGHAGCLENMLGRAETHFALDREAELCRHMKCCRMHADVIDIEGRAT